LFYIEIDFFPCLLRLNLRKAYKSPYSVVIVVQMAYFYEAMTLKTRPTYFRNYC